jgi:eukaryotic-like serine/threonine-protein kinase
MAAEPVDDDRTVSSTGAPPRVIHALVDADAADPDETATLDPERAGKPREAPPFPIARWDRYEAVRFLGSGGMGKVFLARDRKLGREVAIKLVHGNNPAHTARLLAEARAQARVDHPRVCKVYEVGEVEGEVYIAMQYIAGGTLAAMREELSVEQKAMVLREVAIGLHEAHRAGIVHRDVKPGNIMVVRAEDGALDPFVMDFGLARSIQEGLTETGAVLGTPHYMSPEQARGEVAKLDRRSDVYSLGATLYYMLTGKPSVPGENALEVLSNVSVVEPIPPTTLDRDIPADLSAIVLKCLEKERSGRYESARALSEDLDRFLRGDPVSARATGPLYRLQKRLAKHKRAAAALSVAIVVVLAALGWALVTRAQASERERLARRFTELVERIESMARYSALSPLHDVRADRAAIRAKMAELEGEIARGGAVARGPGRYALGRGYLALDDEAKAEALLDSAWKHGYRDPRAAYALAVALGRLYRRRLAEADRIENKEEREAKKRVIEHRYRDPALSYLRKSQGAEVASAEYVAALGAFYEDRLDDALRHLDAIGAALPWFWEAEELRGAVLQARANQRAHRGEREQAEADFEAGRRAYEKAATIGESVPRVYEALGELEYAAMMLELYGKGRVDPPFERGVLAAKRALSLLPDHYESLVLTAELKRRLGEHRARRGGDAETLLREAVAADEAAIQAAPERAEAREALGRALYQWGATKLERNQDPEPDLKKALAIFQSLPPNERSYDVHLYLGLIQQAWADYDDQVGRDSLGHRGEAISAYRAATALDPTRVGALINLGTTYFARASQPKDKDPDADLEEAEKALAEARTKNPTNVVPYFYGGQVHELMAEQKRARGGDARPDLTTALDLYRQGIAIDDKLPHLHNGAGGALLQLAQEAWDRGKAPDELVDRARAAFERAIAVAPQQGFGYNNVAEAWMRRARYQLARGEDPRVAAQAAAGSFLAAIDRLGEHPTPWGNLAGAHVIAARFEIDRGLDPRASLAVAIEAASEALSRNPREGHALEVLGEAREIGARYDAARGLGSERDFEEAEQAYRRALEVEPDSEEARLAQGRLDLAWAAWTKAQGKDPTPILNRALALAEAVLGKKKGAAEALALRADLALALAEAAERPEDQREKAARAAADFARALADNANLEHAFKGHAALAQRLAQGR